MISHAIYFCDALTLSGNLQRGLNSPEKVDRNQCTPVALDSGLAAVIPGQERNIPTAALARQLAAELRWGEWGNPSNGALTDTYHYSKNGRIAASLFRDIRNHNRDRDCRSLCIFASGYLGSKNRTVRAVGILRPFTGDTSSQIDLIGDISFGRKYGLVNLLCSGEQMRRLREDGETCPPPSP